MIFRGKKNGKKLSCPITFFETPLGITVKQIYFINFFLKKFDILLKKHTFFN